MFWDIIKRAKTLSGDGCNSIKDVYTANYTARAKPKCLIYALQFVFQFSKAQRGFFESSIKVLKTSRIN